MHEQLACPHCGKQFAWQAKYAGKAVRCSKCQQPFQIPLSASGPSEGAYSRSAAIEPSSTASSDSQSDSQFGLELPDAASEAGGRLQRTDRLSFWYLFDFKFERYLTPWIIRFYWICALGGAAIFIVAFAVDTVIDLGTAKDTPSSQSIDPEMKMVFDFAGLKSSQSNGGSGVTRSFLWRILWRCRMIPLLVFSLTSIRLACEFGIVAFNISNSLKTIEQRMRRRRR